MEWLDPEPETLKNQAMFDYNLIFEQLLSISQNDHDPIDKPVYCFSRKYQGQPPTESNKTTVQLCQIYTSTDIIGESNNYKSIVLKLMAPPGKTSGWFAYSLFSSIDKVCYLTCLIQ